MKVEEKKREGIFEKMAMFFYRKCASGGFMGFSGKGIEADLRQLYPGMGENKILCEKAGAVPESTCSGKPACGGDSLPRRTACPAAGNEQSAERKSRGRGKAD